MKLYPYKIYVPGLHAFFSTESEKESESSSEEEEAEESEKEEAAMEEDTAKVNEKEADFGLEFLVKKENAQQVTNFSFTFL